MMKLPHRRQFLHLAAGAAALPAVSRFAWAQTYPTRPVRHRCRRCWRRVDIVARVIAQSLSERLGQPFIVENRPGAGGNLATEAVVRAPPGRLYAASGHRERNQRDALRQAHSISSATSRRSRVSPAIPIVMVVNPSVPGQDRSRVHRLCQGQSGQDQYGLGWERNATARRRRAFQNGH